MNWLTNFVRPKLRGLVRQKEIPENLWLKCTSCGEMIFHRELDAHFQVCTHCGHHMRLPAAQRLEMLFDDGAYTRIELPKFPVDPLRFKDRRRYTDRLKDAKHKRGDEAEEQDALIVAHGTIGGQNAVIAVFDFSFMGGSMGVAVGEGIVAAAKLAVVQDAALIVVPSSGGARMQEGILSLMQMARTTIAVEEVREAGLPYIVLLADPTTGGVSASFAMLGDIAIAEPGAVIGFAGARVIEQTIRETLPDGFQRAEYLLEHGMIDMVVTREELRPTLARLLDLLRNPGPKAPKGEGEGEVATLPRPAEAEAEGTAEDNAAQAGEDGADADYDEAPAEAEADDTPPTEAEESDTPPASDDDATPAGDTDQGGEERADK